LEVPEVNPQAVTYGLNPAQLQVGAANGPGVWLAPPGTPLPATTKAAFASPWSIIGYTSVDGPTVGQATTVANIIPWQSITPLRSVITERSVTMKFIMWQLNDLTMALYFDQAQPTVTSRVDPSCGTTISSPAVTDTAALATDVGSAVSGTGIPAGATIVAATAGTGFTLSAPATATGAAVALTISDGSFTMPVLSGAPQHLHSVAIDSLDGNDVFRIGFTRASLSAVADMTVKRGEAVPMEVTLTGLDDSGTMATVMLGKAA
jgi:hypothetical protein